MTRPWTLLPLLLAVACTTEGDDPPESTEREAESDTDTDADADADADADTDTTGLVGPHDGVYTVTLHREGGQFALGTVEVTLNAVTADFRNNDGLTFTVTGTVEPSGEIVDIEVVPSESVEVEVTEARIDSGVIEATYTLDGEAGVLAGSLDGARLAHDPVHDFDGTYEFALVRDDEEVANAVLDIKAGAFDTVIITETQTVELEGHVTSDGILVLTETGATNVIAEATIDQDSFAIEGIYRAGDLVGRVYGKRSD